MNLHASAALSWSGRRRLCKLVVDEGWTVTAAAAAAGVSVRCARKWVGRYRLEGDAGLHDRSSAPRHVANRTAQERIAVIVKLRQLRFTAAEIAETLALALSTVSGILTRLGLGRLGRIGLEQPQRYERSRPGELLHVDVKKLGRIDRPGHRVTGSRHDRRDQGKKGSEIFDGNPWELVQGEDFDSKPETFIANARAQAKRRGGTVKTRMLTEGDRRAVVLQFRAEP